MSSSSLSKPVRPDELVRRISEIDLNALNTRRRAGTLTAEDAPVSDAAAITPSTSPTRTGHYTREELLRLKSGVPSATPQLPNVPPPTPVESLPTPPDDGELAAATALNPQQTAEPGKKKKKKSSGKNKKAAPTGFEG